MFPLGKPMQRLLRCGVSICLLTLMVVQTAAFALPSQPSTFSDVPYGHAYHESIETAASQGLINGTGNGRFSPDEYLTMQQLNILLTRARNDGSQHSWSLIYQYETNGLVSGEADRAKVTGYLAAYCITKLAGYKTPYAHQLYNLPANDDAGADAYLFLQQVGLISLTQSGERYVTRAQAIDLIVRLMFSGETYIQPEPPVLASIPIEEEHTGEYSKALTGLYGIPQTILTDFQKQGWKIVTGRTYIDEWSAANPDVLGTDGHGKPVLALALTSYKDKTIYIGDDRREDIYHEMGHYYMWRCGLMHNTTWQEIFKEESPAARPLVGAYATTNANEYFAECFSFWMQYKKDPLRNELKELAPRTCQVLQELQDGGWTNGYTPLEKYNAVAIAVDVLQTPVIT